jgi:hypothetical protein
MWPKACGSGPGSLPRSPGRIAGKGLRAPHLAALPAMTMRRLERPGSKPACHGRWLERVWLPQARDLASGQLQRALDLLAEHGDAIGQAVLWSSVDLLEPDVDPVLCDAATARLERDEADAAGHGWRGLTFEPLRRRGHSKEGRDDDPPLPDVHAAKQHASSPKWQP